MEEFEKKVVDYYLSIGDDDEAEEKTCKRFDISSDTLYYILMSDFVDNHSTTDEESK